MSGLRKSEVADGLVLGGLPCSPALDLSEIEDSECDGCMAFQLANLALRNDVRKLCGLLLSVQFVAYQPKEVREIIEGLANVSREQSQPGTRSATQ